MTDPDEIRIVDAVNPDRTLGYVMRHRLPHLSEESRHDQLCYPIPSRLECQPVRRLSGYMVPDMVEIAKFRRCVSYSKDGYSAEVVLSTYSPLPHLARMDIFRYSGEGWKQAEHRRWSTI